VGGCDSPGGVAWRSAFGTLAQRSNLLNNSVFYDINMDLMMIKLPLFPAPPSQSHRQTSSSHRPRRPAL
jgi:hypothetical protein